VVVDNPSWVTHFAQEVVDLANRAGDTAFFYDGYNDVPEGNDIACFLGCVGIAKSQVLARSRRNLVVHSSDLPKGRGFAPLAWQIIAGQSDIPTCLIDAAESVDAGEIVFKENLTFNGTE
jgi:methionyl-tRNA formyltransferase